MSTRVALVSWHTSPLAAPGAGRAGGMNVYVRALAGALARRGLEVDIVTRATRPAMRRLAPGVRVLGVAGVLDALPRYDVVHSHYWQSAPVAELLVRRDRARHVHTFHTLGEVKNATLAPGDVGETAARLSAERALVDSADAVVVATAAERRQLVHGLGAAAGNIHVVAPGVDGAGVAVDGAAPVVRAALGMAVDGAAPVVRAALGVAPGDALAVHVGRVQPLKGIDLALRGLALAGPRLGRRCVLALAGGPSGPAGRATVRALRREAAALPAGVSVRWLGRVPRGWLAPLLGAADVAVVGSRSESFCLAALEALACGTPVVGTAVGGLPALLRGGDAGRVVTGRTAGAFAAGLGDVLGADAAAACSLRDGAVAVARDYRWETTAAGVAAAYGL